VEVQVLSRAPKKKLPARELFLFL